MGFTAAAEVAAPAVADILGSSFAGDAAFTLGADAAAGGAIDLGAGGGTALSSDLASLAAGDSTGGALALADTSGGTGLTTGAGATGLTDGTGIGLVAPATATGLTDATGAAIMAPAATSAAETLAGGATTGAGLSLGDILSGAKTGAQIIGGLGKMAGGVAGLTSGANVSPQRADPFAQYRSGLAAQLNQLLTSPQTVTTTPGYQFNLAQGLQAQQAQQASQGRLVSGGALLQSQQYGQQLASETYQQQLQNLASLSGAYQSPATGTGAVQNTALGNTANMFGGIGAIAQGLGVATGMSPLDTLYSNYNKSSPAMG
jgi:hypothetical protein